MPMAWGLYKAEYLMSTLSFDIVSFHRAAVNEPPQSDEIAEGTPKRFSQPCKKAEEAAKDVASFIGMHLRYLEVLHIAVRMYL